jgi:hypothetical protein
LEMNAISQRSALLVELGQAIGSQEWDRCIKATFRILYALPEEPQLGLAQTTIRRYWPHFELKWPGVSWPANVLDGLEQWVETCGRRVPAEPAETDPADAAFLFAVDAVLLAYVYRTDRLILTSSCVAAVNAAIEAQRTTAWMQDDPDAVAMWKAHTPLPGRNVSENVAANVVAEREWTRVVNWMRDQKVWTYPDVADVAELERDLERWRDREYLLIVPGR